MGLRPRGSEHHQAKLDENKVRRIRAAYASGTVTFAALAKAYGVSSDTVFNVVYRVTWKHVQ